MTLAVEVFVEVLRVRLLRGVVAFAGVAGAFDLTGINSLGCVYSHIIPIKKPLWGVLLRTETKKSSFSSGQLIAFNL